MRRRWYGALMAAVLLTPAAAFAQQTRAGAEFRVNSYVTGSQRRPEVLFRAGGSFLVTWSGIDSLDGRTEKTGHGGEKVKHDGALPRWAATGDDESRIRVFPRYSS